MKKTYIPKQEDIKRNWYVIDAKDKVLGRLASKIARILLGKHKPIFSRHIDVGDYVIVVNASQIKITGRKASQKIYRRYSGYPGGLKEIPFEIMFKKKPETVLKLAVKRMLPKGKLGEKMFKKLKVYAGPEHPHQAQCPKTLEV